MPTTSAAVAKKKKPAPIGLTARSVAEMKPGAKPYYVTDANVPGLALRVGSAALGGAKSWSIRYRIGKRMRRYTLGDLKALTLASARELGRDARTAVKKGIDPAQKKQDDRTAETVGTFAETFIEQHAKKKKSWKSVKSRLDNDVLPKWRHKLMTEVTRRDVRDLLDGIAKRPAPISANRVRALLSKFFNVAIQEEVVDANPVTGTARPGVERRRDRVLTPDEIRKFWAGCNKMPAEMAATWQLRLLTAQRANEVHDLTWDELDLAGGWWTLPATRSKNKLSHRVPLSPPALAILKDLRKKEDARLKAQKVPKPSPFVLRNARGKKQQAAAAKLFKLENFNGHDLRRTAASLMTGSGTSRLVVSKVLNHAESGVTAVYDRHSYDAEKRVALDAWARTLATILKQKKGQNVVAFTRA